MERGRLSGLLDTAPLEVKAIVMGANGTATYASRGNFLPYFVTTEALLVLSGEGEETKLRGITLDVVGAFTEAVGMEVFRRHDNSDVRWHQDGQRTLAGVQLPLL